MRFFVIANTIGYIRQRDSQ